MKSFENSKFAELKKDIAELKGGKAAAVATAEAKKAKDESIQEDRYRTTHYAKITATGKKRPVFWKVALAARWSAWPRAPCSFIAAWLPHLLDGLLGGLSPLGETGAAMAMFGALGASFGINRDIFRRVFDTTDLWSKGIASNGNVREQQISAGEEIEGKIAKNPSPNPR